MPGILPMKVIKVGSTAQSRIAQACDRCRSKKIRCDGVRPTCSQCSSVGFECRTSDKLSRRAFPRGYTESLEERVRSLETEVRELKDLLDEKDEKIDMLSRMHANRRPSPSASEDACSPRSLGRNHPPSPPREDTFHVQSSPLLMRADSSDSHFMGPSSGRTFIETLKVRIQETGKTSSDFSPQDFLHIKGPSPLPEAQKGREDQIPPPRLFSDRCVNVYFQEWAPLFPVLHKPTFLRIYDDFVSDPSKIDGDNYKNALLYLVFSIAGLSQAQQQGTPSSDNAASLAQVAACDSQWSGALDQLLMDDSIETLKALVLAIMYCTLRGDHRRLQHYKGIAVGLSHRLGLHQSQKRFSFGALTGETRKKVFWTLYTLDCFSAAALGLPKLLKEDDVQAEYPADIDDEYITEKGFQPTLPGESTRVSNALALFRVSRILARVLADNYPAQLSHELSLQGIDALGAELDAWRDALPPHLRLNFVQGKPSTDVTGSRSPLLALAYHYTRTLVYRPAVGSSLGPKAAPCLLAVAESSKSMVQIVELLDERRMMLSFCLNRDDLLVMCGVTLLYHVLGLPADSKMLREDERTINSVVKMVGPAGAAPSPAGTHKFVRIASRLVSVDGVSKPATAMSTSSMSPASSSASPGPSTAARKPRSLYEGHEHEQPNRDRMRRMTMPNLAEPDAEFIQDTSNALRHSSLSHNQGGDRQNLDYLSLDNNSSTQQHGSMPPPPTKPRGNPVSSAEWEVLLGTMDGGMNNVYDAIYGGRGFVNSDDVIPTHVDLPQHQPPSQGDWSPDSWDLSTFHIAGDQFGAPGTADLSAAAAAGMVGGEARPEGAKPQSVVSLSDESLSSGEDVAPSELGLSLEYPGSNDGFMIQSMDAYLA